jgi:thymidylate kinase
MRGKFIVIDGCDGIGKGVFLQVFIDEAKRDGKRVFDVHKFWKENNFHPNPQDIIGNYDVVITSEPTFVGVGHVIRTELITKNNRSYSAKAVAQAYGLDRHILAENFTKPLLEAGINVFQSRSFASSIVFQRQTSLDQGNDLSFQEILAIPGNTFCYHENPMDFLIVPTIKDVSEVIRRLQGREKNDNCEFENLPFQSKIQAQYESEEFKKIFTDKGIKIISMDAGFSIEFSKEQARKFYQENIRK